jgi:hypothetical protein
MAKAETEVRTERNPKTEAELGQFSTPAAAPARRTHATLLLGGRPSSVAPPDRCPLCAAGRTGVSPVCRAATKERTTLHTLRQNFGQRPDASLTTGETPSYDQSVRISGFGLRIAPQTVLLEPRRERESEDG